MMDGGRVGGGGGGKPGLPVSVSKFDNTMAEFSVACVEFHVTMQIHPLYAYRIVTCTNSHKNNINYTKITQIRAINGS